MRKISKGNRYFFSVSKILFEFIQEIKNYLLLFVRVKEKKIPME